MKNILIATSALGLCLAGSAALAAPDWSKVPVRKVTLLYPGVSSMERMLNGADHDGSAGLKKNESCAGCHDQGAADLAAKVAAADPTFPKGKPASIPVTVQAAHDSGNLYLRFQWKATAASGGKPMDPDNQIKLAVMLDDNKVEYGAVGGCWAACHHDVRTMPDANAGAAKNPKAKALGWEDGVTKYLKESRTGIEIKKSPRGGWDKLKPDAEIDAALKAGKFLDLIQYKSAKGAKPTDGYVLDARHMTGGKSLVGADGKNDGGNWTVTFTRKLASGTAGDHAIEPGKLYNIGFAIHDDHANARFHHVSFGYTMGLDNAKADINVLKQ